MRENANSLQLWCPTYEIPTGYYSLLMWCISRYLINKTITDEMYLSCKDTWNNMPVPVVLDLLAIMQDIITIVTFYVSFKPSIR